MCGGSSESYLGSGCSLFFFSFFLSLDSCEREFGGREMRGEARVISRTSGGGADSGLRSRVPGVQGRYVTLHQPLFLRLFSEYPPVCRSGICHLRCGLCCVVRAVCWVLCLGARAAVLGSPRLGGGRGMWGAFGVGNAAAAVRGVHIWIS